MFKCQIYNTCKFIEIIKAWNSEFTYQKTDFLILCKISEKNPSGFSQNNRSCRTYKM